MSSVFVHVRKSASSPWTNEKMTFERIPCVGEYLVQGLNKPWYKVQLVVHCPFENADFDAEVYAIEVDHLEEIAGLGEV